MHASKRLSLVVMLRCSCRSSRPWPAAYGCVRAGVRVCAQVRAAERRVGEADARGARLEDELHVLTLELEGRPSLSENRCGAGQACLAAGGAECGGGGGMKRIDFQLPAPHWQARGRWANQPCRFKAARSASNADLHLDCFV